MNTPATLLATRTWSTYQEAVFGLFTHGEGNGVIEAVAGSGKTSTLIEGLKRWKAINPNGRAAFMCFNKSIANELQAKVPAGVDASTLHSAGFRALRSFKGIRVDGNKTNGYAATLATEAAEGVFQVARGVEEDLVRAYDLLKGTLTDLTDVELCDETLASYTIEMKYKLLSLPLLAKLDTLCRQDTTRCSFGEMLSFVVDHGLPMTQYDLLCVDESQDMNMLQIELLKRMVKLGGRLIAVGDSKQAIYRFRGADSAAMDRIRVEFKVPTENELPLSISYRCPRAVVREARQWVPHMESSPTAEEGAIVHADGSQLEATLMAMTERDMAICRCNGPLVSCALLLIKKGRKASVRGRDIGQNLKKLVKDLGKKHDGTITGLLKAVAVWEEREVQRLAALKKNAQAQNAADRAETLGVLCEGLSDLDALNRRIDSIFSDEIQGVVFSSGHKSKGLEADKVVWLQPSLNSFFEAKAEENKDLAGAESERCVSYVMCTRARKTLVYQPIPRKGE
jgi:superfamily I DNA/RNA helicase